MVINETAKKLQIPVRADKMPDLNNWQAFMEMNGFKSLGDLLAARKQHCSNETAEGILLSSAIGEKRYEIAKGFVKDLCEEGLSISEAISILELARKIIMGSKFSR